MSKLAPCPLCGKPPHVLASGKVWCTNWKCEILKVAFTRNRWNRLAGLVRKGHQFEWLERSEHNPDDCWTLTGFTFGDRLRQAREWWRKRRAKR